MWRWCSRASPNTPYMANVLSETRVAGNMEVRAIPPNWIRLARVLRGWFARVRLLGKVRPYVPVAVGAFLYYYAFMSVLLHRTDEGTLISGAVRVADRHTEGLAAACEPRGAPARVGGVTPLCEPGSTLRE